MVDSQVVVSFTVPGLPAPQGSKTKTKWGVREDNPRTKPWRASVAGEAMDAMQGRDPLVGPVRLEVSFYFPRPKGHFRTGRHIDQLRPAAPHHHTVKPDVDKLVRAVADSLSGIVVRDDAQIAVVAAEKLYGPPHARVTVTPLSAPLAARSHLLERISA